MPQISKSVIEGYRVYLQLERSMSPNTVEAYMHDLNTLLGYLETSSIDYKEATLEDFKSFVEALSKIGISARSRARIISGIKAFYKYCVIDRILKTDPTELLELPKIPQYLPSILSIQEIEKMIDAIDLTEVDKYSKLNLGDRNRAMLEILYGSGVRVSELVGMRISDINLTERFVKIMGKGSKERLVPLSEAAIGAIKNWMIARNVIDIKHKQEDFLFLNRRGSHMSREMVFIIIKKLAEKAGIVKAKEGEYKSPLDIIENPKNLKFKEMESAQTPRSLDDVALAFINVNYALDVGLKPTKDALILEDKDSPYTNYVATKVGNENNPKIKALDKAILTPEVKDFIIKRYQGAVIGQFAR